MGGIVFEAYCDKGCKRKIVGAYDNSNVKSFEMIQVRYIILGGANKEVWGFKSKLCFSDIEVKKCMR